MAKPKKTPSKVDQLIDELLADCQRPEDIVGESGLLKQLSQRLIERSLTGELTHHLNTSAVASEDEDAEVEPQEPPKNNRNGHTKKTIQTKDRSKILIEVMSWDRSRSSTKFLE